jgi:hypothetical protein
MDLTQDPTSRKLVADVEALSRRVRKLASEVPESYRADALVAIGVISRDMEAVLYAYNQWDTALMLDAAEAMLRTTREGFEEIRPYPLGSPADQEIIALADAVRLDRHQLKQQYLLANA